MSYFNLLTNSPGFLSAFIKGYGDYLVNCDATPTCNAKPDEHLIINQLSASVALI